jgi:hypothetical protein
MRAHTCRGGQTSKKTSLLSSLAKELHRENSKNSTDGRTNARARKSHRTHVRDFFSSFATLILLWYIFQEIFISICNIFIPAAGTIGPYVLLSRVNFFTGDIYIMI